MRKIPVVWAIASLATISSGLSAQIITGRVLEVGSGRPISSASVTLVAKGRTLLAAESDSTGGFQVPVPRAGWYSLRIERFGYGSETSDSLEVGARENVEVVIRLSVTAVRLEPLLVIERRRDIRPRSEFERRPEVGSRSGLGVFITREALDSTSSASVTGVLARVPLLGIRQDGVPTSLSQGTCTPTLYLNGARFQLAPGESIDDMILPSTLEGIEVYRNRTELPREFAGIGHCSAIVFWTRQGDPGRRAPWRFLAAGGAILGLLVVFVTN